ncbi:hypothetical protein LNI91_05565 [Tenacibaculum dicentrarchi]|nr:hypothetical protein [Tenacibaculum dicentrarchi]
MTTKKDEILKAYENRTQNEITLYQISDYIDELYAPYVKVFKNHTDFTDYLKKNNTPRYVFTDERNKSIKSLKNKKGKLYVIFNASTDEKNKIKKFIEIENKHNKLVRVQILQRKLYTKETEYQGLEYFNKIEEEIKLLFEDVLELSKPTESNATKKEPQQEKEEITTPTIKDDLSKVLIIIKPLSGKWRRKEILNKTDYNRLIEYATSIIKNNKLPLNPLSFPLTNTTIDFIRKTFHLVYLELSKSNKKEWVELIQLFKQLEKTEYSTTFQKFSAYTGNYENDKKTLITY